LSIQAPVFLDAAKPLLSTYMQEYTISGCCG
jgi:hypothetical protein